MKAKAGFIDLLQAMRKESEEMAEDFEVLDKHYNPTKEAISSMASKQAAMCTILIELMKKSK